MKTMNSFKSLLVTFCAVGVLAAANQSWADAEIANCAQVNAATETDADSTPGNKASSADILAAVTGGTAEDDESCAVLTLKSIYDFGDAPKTYGTLLAEGGAQHEIMPGLKLGANIDDEADGQDSTNADADGADEDGVVGVTSLQDGQAVTLQVTATNTLGKDAKVACWIDYDGSGTFDTAEFGSATIAAGSNGVTVPVTMPNAPADASTKLKGGVTYARCRLSTDAALDGSKPTGSMADGEVEDYKVTFTAQPVSDLALMKRVDAAQATPIKPGDAVKFVVEVYNQGTTEATAIEVTDYIPTGLTLSDKNWTDNGDGTATLKTPIASLAAGTSTTVEINFTVAANATKGTLSNVAEISAAKDKDGNPFVDKDSTPDSNGGNDPVVKDDVIDNTDGDEDDHDKADITITVDPKVDVELVKSVTDDKGQPVTTVRRGQTVIYTLTATNKGPDAASNVTVKDTLPASLTFVSAEAGYDNASGVWTVGDMANGETKTVKITATVK